MGAYDYFDGDLLEQIEHAMPEYSKGQKRIARYILANYDKAAYMRAAQISKVTGVSESTVVRFAVEMGYEGYPEFITALRELIRNRLTAVQRVAVSDNLIGDDDVIDKVLRSDVDKIRQTAQSIDREAFNLAVDKIANARKVYILGVRASAMLAGFLHYNFRMMFENVQLIQTSSGSEMFEQLINMTSEDVLIAISFPRYSRKTVNAVDYARRVGANVVVLTDCMQSPISHKADQLLIAKSDMVTFVDSLSAPLSIINALILAVSRKNPDELRERLTKLEGIWDDFEVYSKYNSIY